MQINVTKTAGIVGDYNTDCWPAFQQLINSCPKIGTTFYVPAGLYRFSKPLDFSVLGDWRMFGDGPQVSRFIMSGKDTGAVVVSKSNMPLSVVDMSFVGNLSTHGTGFYTENTQNAYFERCWFGGGIGFDARDPFLSNWHHCNFSGQNGLHTDIGSDIGLLIFGATNCTLTGSCDFTGWREGLRAAGHGISVYGGRFEVNGIGMRLGADPNGNPWVCHGSVFSSISMEANDTAIRLQVCGASTFESIGFQGSTNSPTGYSQMGIDIQTAANCTMSSIVGSGIFKQSAFFLRDSQENHHLLFQAMQMQSDTPGIKIWDIPNKNLQEVYFQACNL